MESNRRAKKVREIMTVEDIAKFLGIHEVTVYRMTKDNKIPAYRIGGQWRFKKDQIEDWLEDQANEYFMNQQKGRKNKKTKSANHS